ncbi:MAG: TrkA family potassium uptake protein [Bacteroidales bacterium]|nr:TrkA family potassium uptake protein [Bacteroidales bacterium]
MNFIIIGLGNFGASLAKKLTALGHDVIGVDKDLEKVEFFKDTVKNTISMDITDIHALKTLPLKDCDMVVVCIGDDFGSSVKTTALLKKLGVEKIYGRESSLIHKTVLNAVGVCNTINPEYDTAVVFAEKLIMTGVWSIYNISDDIKIAEISVPEEYAGKKLSELDVSGPDNIGILAVKYIDTKLSKPSLEKWIAVDTDDPSKKEFIIRENMRLVIKGKKKDILEYLSV